MFCLPSHMPSLAIMCPESIFFILLLSCFIVFCNILDVFLKVCICGMYVYEILFLKPYVIF